MLEKLGESRVGSNHSVAAMHYYHGGHVPKSSPFTLQLPSFYKRKKGNFFLKLQRLGAYFMVL